MLQQHQHQMTMKRAASGIMEGVLPGGAGGKRHSGGASGSPHHSGAGGEALQADQGAAVWACCAQRLEKLCGKGVFMCPSASSQS